MKPPLGVVLTIGHSNRPLAAFLEMLRGHAVDHLVDVRTLPRSRANPQFNTETLPAELSEEGIGYTHAPGLGGLRKPRPDSPNGGWRNAGFRGYADYMLTPQFERELKRLITLAQAECVAIMCAEALPWRCHRSLIADALVVRGIAVEHIMTAAKRDPHALRSWGHADGVTLTYPPEAGTLWGTATAPPGPAK